jgi:cyclopropane-fatty-acyl-phospholipid synthase
MFDPNYGGFSFAPDQIQFANKRAAAGVADKVKFHLIDHRDVEGQFDRICSIGMIEHLGKPNCREYYAKNFDLLRLLLASAKVDWQKHLGGSDV